MSHVEGDAGVVAWISDFPPPPPLSPEKEALSSLFFFFERTLWKGSHSFLFLPRSSVGRNQTSSFGRRKWTGRFLRTTVPSPPFSPKEIMDAPPSATGHDPRLPLFFPFFCSYVNKSFCPSEIGIDASPPWCPAPFSSFFPPSFGEG